MDRTLFYLIRKANKSYFKIDSELVLYWPSVLVDLNDGTKSKTSRSFSPSRHTCILTDPGVTLSIRPTLRLSAFFIQTSALTPTISELSNRKIK